MQAFVYQSGMEIDADGAYRAYHPNNRLGLDTIKDAGRPGNWWALATDTGKPNGRPVIQRKGDPAPGFYVSMTALYDSSIEDEHNPKRFVDAATIPYVVLPPEGFRHAKLGDFATVVNLENGKVAGAIVADESAPGLPMGEGSIALANLLGIDSNPRTGGIEQGVAYVIYPASGNGEPRPTGEITNRSQAYFTRWGALRHLHSCLQ
ncbi:MAG TPA: glycoside hydrolase family 75 protein [Terracidiphilus sp.]|nr:glycoside hydrolase family 75 protein [Terracidiphilus sp.]